MPTVFPLVVYSLCFVTSSLCAALLGRMFALSRARMLFWSAACFVVLGLANLWVIFDILIFPEIDFRLLRLGLSFTAVAVLLFGFIWDTE